MNRREAVTGSALLAAGAVTGCTAEVRLASEDSGVKIPHMQLPTVGAITAMTVFKETLIVAQANRIYTFTLDELRGQ